jgi:hypothetical protein
MLPRLTLLLFIPVAMEACSCLGSISPCGVVSQNTRPATEAVFIGTVSRIHHDQQSKPTTGWWAATVDFAVTENFHNAKEPLFAIALTGACDASFDVGGEYLVFANLHPGAKQWTSTMCTRTGLTSQRQAEIALLRARHSSPVVLVSVKGTPTEGVRIELNDGQNKTSAKTNRSGYAVVSVAREASSFALTAQSRGWDVASTELKISTKGAWCHEVDVLTESPPHR